MPLTQMRRTLATVLWIASTFVRFSSSGIPMVLLLSVYLLVEGALCPSDIAGLRYVGLRLRDLLCVPPEGQDHPGGEDEQVVLVGGVEHPRLRGVQLDGLALGAGDVILEALGVTPVPRGLAVAAVVADVPHVARVVPGDERRVDAVAPDLGLLVRVAHLGDERVAPSLLLRAAGEEAHRVAHRRRLATSLPPIHLVAVIADTHLDATSTRHGHADPREFVALPAIAEKSHQMSSSNAHSVVALEGWDAR